MTAIRLKIDADRLTLDDFILLDEGSSQPRSVKQILSRFVVDKRDKYLPEEQAAKLVGKLTLSQLNDVMEQFKQAIQEMQESAVSPEASGGS